MSSNRAGGYRLTPQALEDLDDIWRYTAENWSVNQADKYIDELVDAFGVIASSPQIAREYPEFDPPVRIFVYQTHLIVYLIQNDHIFIVRVLGARQNWQVLLKTIET